MEGILSRAVSKFKSRSVNNRKRTDCGPVRYREQNIAGGV